MIARRRAVIRGRGDSGRARPHPYRTRGEGATYGAVEEVEEPSRDRREPQADPLCGGALYAYISYPRQLTLKAEIIADALTRIGRVTWTPAIDVAASPEDGYRMRARLHLRDGRAGFFREGSHETCSARQTGQLLPATSDVVEESPLDWPRRRRSTVPDRSVGKRRRIDAPSISRQRFRFARSALRNSAESPD